MDENDTQDSNLQEDIQQNQIPSESKPLEIKDENRDIQLEKLIFESLKNVFDPEINIDVVSLGLVYEIKADTNKRANINMTLTSPTCPLTGFIENEVAFHLEGIVNEFKINWVFNPPWSIDFVSQEAKDMLIAMGWSI